MSGRYFIPEESLPKMDAELDKWVTQFEQDAARVGEQQAVLNMAVIAMKSRAPEGICGLLALAVRRIARTRTGT